MADSEIAVETSAAIIHRQKRSIVTRQELILSARAIFARDGFEHARIEEIALNAGKTRGAFYANFEDKEDVFFAIFENDIDIDRAKLGPLLLDLPTPEQKMDAVAEYFFELTKDRQRMLLNIEFKLYAIRHPSKRKRLADLHAMMCLRCAVPELQSVFPRIDPSVSGEGMKDSLAVGAIIDGLALNHFFNPEALDQAEMARFIQLMLRDVVTS